MAQLLLINPKARNMAKHRTAAQKRATQKMLAANRARRGRPAKTRRRRSNPLPVGAVSTYKRRMRRAARRVTASVRRRRRSNPISLGGASGYMGLFKNAAVQGAGAVAFDLLHGQVQGFLPDALKRTPGKIGAGDAVKALLTAFIGIAGKRVTRGFSERAALGALTVQMRDLMAGVVPASMPMGYYVAAPVVQGTARVSPNRAAGVSATGSPLLNRFVQGPTPLLSGRDAQRREGVSMYR